MAILAPKWWRYMARKMAICKPEVCDMDKPRHQIWQTSSFFFIRDFLFPNWWPSPVDFIEPYYGEPHTPNTCVAGQRWSYAGMSSLTECKYMSLLDVVYCRISYIFLPSVTPSCQPRPKSLKSGLLIHIEDWNNQDSLRLMGYSPHWSVPVTIRLWTDCLQQVLSIAFGKVSLANHAIPRQHKVTKDLQAAMHRKGSEANTLRHANCRNEKPRKKWNGMLIH